MEFDTFSVDLIQDGGMARLALTGELDLAAVPTLEAAIPNLARARCSSWTFAT